MTVNSLLLQETERRYSERTLERDTHLEKLREGSILQADTPERVEKRMSRLSQQQLPLPVVSEAALARIAAGRGSEGIALERVLGKSDLIGITYLELGLLVARSVGRIRIRSSTGQTLGYGTGSLVSPRLVLTNNHVLAAPQEAVFSQVEFNFQQQLTSGAISSVVFSLDPATFFLTDPRLDYTLVAVREHALDGSPLQRFGWNRLIEEEGKAIIGEALNIIQHPNGEPKQLALRENQLIDVLADFLHYHTDTAPGSSGSPVFNDQWEVVALHHSGVPRRDGNGNLLTKDRTIWRPEMGEHRIDWIANEGARVSRLVRHIKAQTLGAAQSRLRAEMFEAISPVPRPEMQQVGSVTGNSTAVGRQPVVADGLATWTIPLQLSIRLGGMDAPSDIDVISLGSSNASNGNSFGAAPAAAPAVQDKLPADDDELLDAMAELNEAKRRPYYSQTQDQQDSQDYYQGLPSPRSMSKAEFFSALSKLVMRTHETLLTYNPAKNLYPWVDLQPNMMIRSIYSGLEFTPEQIIREDFRIARERAARMREILLSEADVSTDRLAEEIDLLEAAMPFNCEHVVPQSWFDKREPMRGDLHHLFACESNCNSFRGNTPYFDFADFEEVVRSDCGKREENKFEPEAGKGQVARAVLYFLLRYPRQINNSANEYTPDRIETLIDWHKSFPVTRHEKHRNAIIFKKQKNRNPLIDHPEWVDEIDFLKGLG